MSNGKRDIYASDLKLKVTSEAMSGDKMRAQLANEYYVHPFQIIKRKEQLKALSVPFHRMFSEKTSNTNGSIRILLTVSR